MTTTKTAYRTQAGTWQHFSDLWNEWLPVSPAIVVLLESSVPEHAYSACIGAMHSFLNATPDAGRPSDAMRSVVASYLAGQTL
jgi:hypothetical protein